MLQHNKLIKLNHHVLSHSIINKISWNTSTHKQFHFLSPIQVMNTEPALSQYYILLLVKTESSYIKQETNTAQELKFSSQAYQGCFKINLILHYPCFDNNLVYFPPGHNQFNSLAKYLKLSIAQPHHLHTSQNKTTNQFGYYT